MTTKKQIQSNYDKIGVVLGALLIVTFVLSFLIKSSWANALFPILFVIDILLGIAVVLRTVFNRKLTKIDWLIILLLALGYGILIYKTFI